MGWSCDLESRGDFRDRNNAGTRYSSMVIPDRSTACATELWEVQIPNGVYTVTVGYSDPSYDTATDGCKIEGLPAGANNIGDRGPGTAVSYTHLTLPTKA